MSFTLLGVIKKDEFFFFFVWMDSYIRFKISQNVVPTLLSYLYHNLHTYLTLSVQIYIHKSSHYPSLLSFDPPPLSSTIISLLAPRFSSFKSTPPPATSSYPSFPSGLLPYIPPLLFLIPSSFFHLPPGPLNLPSRSSLFPIPFFTLSHPVPHSFSSRSSLFPILFLTLSHPVPQSSPSRSSLFPIPFLTLPPSRSSLFPFPALLPFTPYPSIISIATFLFIHLLVNFLQCTWYILAKTAKLGVIQPTPLLT